MNPIKDIISGGIDGVLSKGSEILDNFISSPDEKLQAKTEFRKLIQDFEIQTTEQANRVFELEVQDRSNARAMQIAALQQGSWLAKHFLYILASVMILGAFGFTIALFSVKFPEENRNMIEQVQTLFVIGGVVMILQYFFGSSAGSKQKTDHREITEQMKTIDNLTMTRFEKREEKTERNRANKQEDDIEL